MHAIDQHSIADNDASKVRMIVFLHIPKTAGSTFQFILENTFGISACHTNHTKKGVFTQADFDFVRRVFPRLRSIAGHNLRDPLSLNIPDAFYITFLREPVARVISQYHDSVTISSNRLGFEESLRTLENYENIHVKLMAGSRDLDKAKRFLEKAHFVGLTEKFELSLDIINRLCPLKLNLAYQRRRVTPKNRVVKRVDQDSRMIEMARDFNKLDIQLYEFAVNEIFPKVCAKAGVKPTDQAPSHETYKSDRHFNFVACAAYNMLFFRQLNKLRKRRGNKSGPISNV